MNKNEITLAKQCVLTTRDWDTFQAIIRTCLKNKRSKGAIASSPALGAPLPKHFRQ